MGPATQAARHITTGVAKSGLSGFTGVSSVTRGTQIGVRKFTENASQNLKNGAKDTPVIRESKNVADGIANGDFAKATVNAGMVAATASLAGPTGAVKASSSNLGSSFLAGMSMGMIPFKDSSKSNIEQVAQHVTKNTPETVSAAFSFQDAAQVTVGETKKPQPVNYRVYQGNERRARSASPRRRMSVDARNKNLESKSAKGQNSKPVLMPPYLKEAEICMDKTTDNIPKSQSQHNFMSFHNYKPLL